jgi:tRNA threonylcarbamoyladenosine biosynthesis protein TsaE
MLSISPDMTRSAGQSLGCVLRKGDVVFIYGDIGAGKTVFVSGIASALGIGEYITSPTFTIVNYYEGGTPLCHFDAYRLNSPSELFETGYHEYAGSGCVVAVEWAGRLEGIKPANCVEVWIRVHGGSDTERHITINFT